MAERNDNKEPSCSSTSGSLRLTTVSSEREDSGGEASGSSTRSIAEPQTLISQLNNASIIGYFWSIMIRFVEHNSDII